MSKLEEIQTKLKKDTGINNTFELPKIIKVVINVGTGKMRTNPKFNEIAEASLASITGQKPAPRIARKAISGFKVREGEKVGLIVTLRGKKMSDFITKLANIVLPRMRDFRGLKVKGFDGQGNFTLGIAEQIVFPEISHEKSEVLHGMSITVKTTAKNSEEGRELLKAWGFPFEKGASNAK